MSGTSLLAPFGSRFLTPRRDEIDPFLGFRREINRLFDQFLSGPPLPGASLAPGGQPLVLLTPRLEVSETDKELQVTAELPGIDAKDVEITLTDDVLTIRAEKPGQEEESGRDYHVTERSYGTFSRYLRLPFVPDPSQVRAAFKDGVLTVTIQKPEALQRKAYRIDISQESSPSTPAGGEQETSKAAE
jgi:HSP20 family protein